MKFPILIAIGFAAALPLSADVVYHQAPVWQTNGNNVGFSWTSQVDGTQSGFRAYDSFSLLSGATIGYASWEGIYLTGQLTDGAANTAAWDIGIYADAGGVPGALLSGTTLTAAQVNPTILGSGEFGATPVTIYQFTAALTPFQAVAGTTYWFSPLSEASSFEPFFSWFAGTGGDNASAQNQLSNGAGGGFVPRQQDRNFSLSATPEPATFPGLGAGLAIIALARRRVRLS